MEIGKNIKNLRESHGMTQDQLSQKMGITRQALSNYEREINTPDIQTCISIAEIFNISLDEFLLGREFKKTEEAQDDTKVVFSTAVVDVLKLLFLVFAVILGNYGIKYAYNYLFDDATIFLLIKRYISLLLIPFLLFLTGSVITKILIDKGAIKRINNPNYSVNPWIILGTAVLWLVIIHIHLLLRITQTEPSVFKSIMETVTAHDIIIKILMLFAGVIFRVFLY